MKKYAITGPRGAIFRVVDEEPQQAQYYVEITEEQAQIVAAGNNRFFVIAGELKMREDVFEQYKWNNETNEWEEKPLPPPPDAVVAHKVLGQLSTLGVSETDLEDFIKANTPEGPTRIAALNELKRATHFERNHPLVLAVAPTIGITTQEGIDQFFRDANKYKYNQ